MTPEAGIISTRYTKSVIKSCAALSYIEAQARIDDRCYSIPIMNLCISSPIIMMMHLFI
jgi:exoribonuclease R